eukprot:816926-Rhodomonas_salina.1
MECAWGGDSASANPVLTSVVPPTHWPWNARIVACNFAMCDVRGVARCDVRLFYVRCLRVSRVHFRD